MLGIESRATSKPSGGHKAYPADVKLSGACKPHPYMIYRNIRWGLI